MEAISSFSESRSASELLDRVERVIPRVYSCFEFFAEFERLELGEIAAEVMEILEEPKNIWITCYHSTPVWGERLDNEFRIRGCENACNIRVRKKEEYYIVFFPHLLFVSDEYLISVIAHEITHILYEEEGTAEYVEEAVRNECLDKNKKEMREEAKEALKKSKIVSVDEFEERLRSSEVWKVLHENKRALKGVVK